MDRLVAFLLLLSSCSSLCLLLLCSHIPPGVSLQIASTMPLPIPSDLRNGASSSSVSSGNGSLRPSGPVSVDSLLAKQSASQQQMPKFMTKKQRMEQQQKAQKAEEEERQRREKERIEADREFIRRQRAQEAARNGQASSSISSTAPSPSLTG